jgi:ABC-type lipoprotein release transport system permease subunit
MAFDAGRGRTAVPVRSTLGAIAMAGAAVTAAIVVATSLLGLIGNPSQYGQNWSRELNLQFNAIPSAAVTKTMRQLPEVGGYAAGSYGQVRVAGTEVPAIGLDPLEGGRFLTLLAGHAPAGPDQIVLGERTLRSLRLHLGDLVPVVANGRTRRMRVAGIAVFPLFSQATSAATDLGTGAAVTGAVLSRPDPPLCPAGQACYNFVLVRFRPGDSQRVATARLAAAVARAGCPPGLCLITGDQRPSDIRNVSGVRDAPLVLGLVLAFLAVASLAHVVVTGARQRRRDLAILRTLGLASRQVVATVLWQSAAIAVAATGVGVPAGIVAGRWSWYLLAVSLGVADDPAVPVPQTLALIPAALVIACVLAIAPATRAARIRPAAVLRAE